MDKAKRGSLLRDRFRALGGVVLPNPTPSKPKRPQRLPTACNHWTAFLTVASPMGNRRFTRLTNAFSKKVENHEHMLALFFCYYNFCRIHQSLRVTPAMAAGVSNHVWELSDIVALIVSMDSNEQAA
jgi:hypothetical protein